MNIQSQCERILSKITPYYRIELTDSDDKVKHALQQLLQLWSEVLQAANDSSDDELFALNVSRAFLTKIFTITLAKDCFSNDHLYTREILRLSFDLLVKHIDVFTTKTITSITIFLLSNIRLIMELLSSIVSMVWFTDMDLFTEDVYQLFIAMCTYVNEDFKHDNLTDGILSFIWNVSDNTLLVPLLIKTNYPKNIIEWIKIRETKFREDKQDGLIYILLNMARHDDGIDQFNHFNALDILKQAQIHLALPLPFTMIEVLLTDRKYIKLESMEILNTLVQMTIDAAKNEEYRSEGSHVCEPLAVLTKMCYIDEILHNVLCKIKLNPSLSTQSIIEIFISLLNKFYPNLGPDNDPLRNFTCVLLFNILCLISNHHNYSQIIYEDKQLIDIIKSAANNEKSFVDIFMPRTMKSIQQAAIDIQTNLHKK